MIEIRHLHVFMRLRPGDIWQKMLGNSGIEYKRRNWVWDWQCPNPSCTVTGWGSTLGILSPSTCFRVKGVCSQSSLFIISILDRHLLPFAFLIVDPRPLLIYCSRVNSKMLAEADRSIPHNSTWVEYKHSAALPTERNAVYGPHSTSVPSVPGRQSRVSVCWRERHLSTGSGNMEPCSVVSCPSHCHHRNTCACDSQQ